MSRRRKKRKQRLYLSIGAVCLLVLLLGSGFVLAERNQTQRSQAIVHNDTPITFDNSKNVYDKMKDKDVIRYLIIGDSIGQSDGAAVDSKWFNQLSLKLQTNHEIIAFPYRVTTPGATVFNGWYDFNARVVEDRIDLVFIVFGQNDQGSMSEEQYGAVYEKLIRDINQKYPQAEILPLIESSIKTDKFPNVIFKLAKHYGMTVIDTRVAFKNSNKPYDSLTNDGVHPNNEGYTYYANQIYKTITSKQTVTINTEKDPLYSESVHYNKPTAIAATTLEEFKSKKQKEVKITFTGKLVGLSVNKNESGGKFKVFLDGKLIRELSSYNKFPVNHKMLLADNLTEGEHTLVIQPSEDPVKSSKIIDIKGIIVSES
ncbi:GDSL-type esterase/lipase family protein [Paenibacillus pasadenensis]|uniref:GDSL-type esterase/lipase family protein n=1 Tax=Paenibacillus pasadenensis TaxID=217090 RepID=UPI00203E103A|nr:GDSL-type esterase/lipase family protein [Paenibacillus pasadenensis]